MNCTECGAETKNRRWCSMACKSKGMIGGGPRWKGGRYTDPHGYTRVLLPEHPRAHHHYGYVLEHILIAEKALGKPLPSKACVHHHDLNRTNNTNGNLVICENTQYHTILHARMRLLQAVADPDREFLCTKCGKIKLLTDFYTLHSRWNGRMTMCKACCAAKYRDEAVRQDPIASGKFTARTPNHPEVEHE